MGRGGLTIGARDSILNLRIRDPRNFNGFFFWNLGQDALILFVYNSFFSAASLDFRLSTNLNVHK